MVEIARHTCIAHNFKAMWGCEFHYNENGEIEFLKRIITHTEKTRYLFEIAKGIDNHAEYSEDSELMRSLTLAVESICKQIALAQLSVGE